MILHNNTKCPNNILSPLLKGAAKFTGAKHTTVIVTINNCKNVFVCGRAHSYGQFLSPRLKTWKIMAEMEISFYIPNSEYVLQAESIFKTMVHEFTHIADFYHNWKIANGKSKDFPMAMGTIRLPQLGIQKFRYRNRPCEVRAKAAEIEVFNSGVEKYGDYIVKLAEWFYKQG